VIDLNHILLFIAVVSPLVLLARIARLRNPRNRGWCIAALIVLAVCALAWVLTPACAGFVGGTFWCLLLLIPSLAERRIDDLLLTHEFPRARRVAVVRRMLHPWEDTPHRPSLLYCLELAAGGRLDLALDGLAAERTRPTPGGRFATALTFALTENWAGLVAWCRHDLALANNPAIHSLYLRALGETGALEDLVYDLATHAETGERNLGQASPLDLVLALAFAGQTEELVRLLSRRFSRLPSERHQFWLGTAELVAGRIENGRGRLEKLRAATHDAILRRSIDHRLASAPKPAPLSASGKMLLARLMGETLAASPAAGRGASGTPAVWALILLNLAMFGVELLLGGATNIRTLHFLGALEPGAVIVRHEYWRLLTALFLHYGPLHLAFNLYALYLLGPELERILGSFKFTLGYLISGLGSSAGVVILSRLRLTDADLLVGASGCVMGVIGVSAGLLLRHRQSPLAGRRLRNLIVIVALQTVFDLSTPQVSLAAHLSGFLTGVGVGVIFACPRRARSHL
jgi:rhomboid protease GluP